MARVYSRKKGKSGSKKPLKRTKPSWVRFKPKEIELLVVKLAKEGNTPSQIGLILRDSYGIPDVRAIISKRITAILKTKKMAAAIPEDLMALMKKSVGVRRHLEQNKQDRTAMRGLQLTESMIRRLIKYYKRNKTLSQDWKYNPENIKLYIE